MKRGHPPTPCLLRPYPREWNILLALESNPVHGGEDRRERKQKEKKKKKRREKRVLCYSLAFLLSFFLFSISALIPSILASHHLVISYSINHSPCGPSEDEYCIPIVKTSKQIFTLPTSTPSPPSQAHPLLPLQQSPPHPPPEPLALPTHN